MVRFETGNSSEDWAFLWDGVNLQNVSPTTTDVLGIVGTELTNTSFVDIDGDGVLEAFTSDVPVAHSQPSPSEVYRMVDGEFVLDRRIVGMRAFQRASGSPETETREIFLPTGAVGPLTVRIYNGTGTSVSGQRVENAVESGRVWWNDQQIAAPNDFGSDVSSIQRTVTPQPKNELKVRLAGSPGGRITIVIDAASWTP